MRCFGRRALWVLVLLGIPYGADAAAARPPRMAVAHLTTDAATEPLGIDDHTPHFRWQLSATARGVRQTALRIFVASRPEFAREGRADVWDSGRITSPDPWTQYAGPVLRARTRYYWTVHVSATPGPMDALAAVTWFETALLDASEWHSEWIAGPERTNIASAADGIADDERIRAAGELCRPPGWPTRGFAAQRTPNEQGECRELRPAPMLRKVFQVTKPIARARVYSAGLAYNALTVNGKAVSTSVLEPGFTNYSRTVLYTTDDVTSLLTPGENVIATELGSGQFDNATRTWDWGWDQAEWRGRPRLRLELHVTYKDGSEDVVLSDGSWRASVSGPTRYDSYYLGETYDARREIPKWNLPGFDDAGWSTASVVSAPAGTPRAEANEPIRVTDTRPPGVRAEPSPGVFVYDVGQNLAGWAEIHVKAPAGTAVEIFYSEKIGPDGRASTNGNDLVFGQLQTDYYVAKGQGDERWTPRFSYKGFQYVQISGPLGQPLAASVTVSVERVLQVRSSLARTSTFETTNQTLARIHRNAVWAIESNMHGIVTDTPVYEKNGWTGDAQLTSGTASLLFDTERLYGKMFQDMLDGQRDTGELPLLSPSSRNYGYVGKPYFKPAACCGATPAWDAFWFVIPWESYTRYGDRRALERTYPAMRKYLDDWIPRWTDKDDDTYAHTLTAGLGDWVPPKGLSTVNALASTAYYARFARIAADAARVLGQTDDAVRYEKLGVQIRADFGARFLSADGVYRDKAEDPFLQTAQILPLAFGLVPDEQRTSVAARLTDDITQARGNHAYVGVLGARYVLPVLTAIGQHDTAYAVATQTAEPSWGYWTDVAGFTSLGEHWSADTRSRNHHMFGAVVQWLYEDLAGIRALTPGYGTIEFRPGIPKTGLDAVSATYDSVRGPVRTSWRRTATGLELDVTVPPTATGRVYVPAPNAAAVTELGDAGPTRADQAAGITLVGVEGDRVVYDVGSGFYRFRVADPK
jgi:alpha-L-rhamnosidase